MATSQSYIYTVNQDQIIKRALRIVGGLPTGDTPTTAQTLEAQQALNDIKNEWQADGMQLWCIKTYSIPLVAGTAAYQIGLTLTSPNVNSVAFLKMINCYKRQISDSTDIPMVPMTRNFYENMSNKTQQGDPNQWWYDPPGNMNTGNLVGTLTLFNCPSTFAATNYTIQAVGQIPLQDFVNTTDTMDFPPYFANALTWGLADQLAYEYPTPVSSQDRITKKAMYHKDIALSFGTEWGSIFFQPNPFWTQESGEA